MDMPKYTPDISKGFSSVCYNIGCNNPATTTIKLPLNERLYCIIHVCDNCLPKYLAHHDDTCYDNGNYHQHHHDHLLYDRQELKGVDNF